MASELTVFGTPTSTATSTVRLTLAEIPSIKYKFCILDWQAKEHQQAEHLARQPWGKIPAIITSDNVQLYESRAICRFLAVKYQLPLLPGSSDATAVGVFEQAQSIETSYFAGQVKIISAECFVKPCIHGITTPNVAAIEAAESNLAKFFDVCEARILEKQDYMAGNTFSLVDIFYIPNVERLIACGFGKLIADRANVLAWWNRCIQRPTVNAFLEEEPLRAVRARLQSIDEERRMK